MKQGNKDVENIIDPYSDDSEESRRHHFPNDIDRTPIGIKVENILEGSLDLIPSPSPSMKIQILV